VLMHAVEDIAQPLPTESLRYVMENVSVDQVLAERPEKHTDKQQSHDNQEREPLPPQRSVKHVADDGQVENQWSRWMHPRKELHEIVIEHPDRFVFRRDVERRLRERSFVV